LIEGCRFTHNQQVAETVGGEATLTGVEPTSAGATEAYRLYSAGSYVEVFSSLGGTVGALRLADSRSGPKANRSPTEILDPPPSEDPAENPWFRGRILFPFNDRIPRGVYRFNGRELQLPLNSPEDGSALHGLVYDRPFTTLFAGSPSAEAATLRLTTRIKPDEFGGYPFDVTLEVGYILTVTTFTLELSVRNTGDQAAPVAFGWHPYLTFGAPIDGLTLKTASSRYVPVDEALLPSGEILPVDGSPFDFRGGRRLGALHLDTALTAPPDGLVVVSCLEETTELMITGDAFGFLQLFTHPDRNSIAVEPVTAATNAFNLPRLGLRILKPGENAAGRVTLTHHRR